MILRLTLYNFNSKNSRPVFFWTGSNRKPNLKPTLNFGRLHFKNKIMKSFFLLALSFLFFISINAQQNNWDKEIQSVLPAVLERHVEFVSMPNVSPDPEQLRVNMKWISPYFDKLGFEISILETPTSPVFLAEKIINPKAKTILFYFHLDGQPVDAKNWDQEDPFIPVLKKQNKNGDWETIDMNLLKGKIDSEWRIFARAAADDKAPITMMLTALEILQQKNNSQEYNVKILLDPEEESGSVGFISTLEKYKDRYAADYMIIMDGPAHNSNKPTLTFGCRGIARCDFTLYGSKLPQHSGHFGNYAPNPVFSMAHLLASMKDKSGKVTIDGFYDGIPMTKEVEAILKAVPDDEHDIRKGLVIKEPDAVGKYYQQALQYPSLNVRHIETSWKGPGLKTVIPEIITAHLDVRLVAETDGTQQIEKVKNHIIQQGYYVIDRAPTDKERLEHSHIATFKGNGGVNAFRTEVNSKIGQKLGKAIKKAFGQNPVSIRTMGGTVPIIPAINTLKIPAIIVPMVNMDNNQHNPNENIRIGNIETGIKMCLAILTMKL